MIPEDITVFIYIFCLVTLVFINFSSSKKFLFLCGFYIPLLYPGLEVGFNLFIFQMIAPIAIFLNMEKVGFYSRRAKGLHFFILYAITLTLIWFTFDYFFLERYKTLSILGLGEAQALYRLPVQLISLMASLFAFYIPQLVSRSFEDIERVDLGFITGAGFSVSVGILLALTTGVGYLAESGKGLIKISGVWIPRLGGLSGEPKMLGAVLVILLLGSFSHILYGKTQFDKKKNVKITLFFSVALIATLSTSAWLGFLIGLIVLFLPFPMRNANRRTRNRLFVLGILISIGFGIFRFESASEIVENRFVGRLYGERSELKGSKDKLIFDVLRKEPIFLLTGFGSGGFDLAAAKEYMTNTEYALNLQYVRTPTPASTGVRLLGDFGLIGILLLVIPVFKMINRCFKIGMIQEGRFILASGVALLFVSFTALAVFSLLLGCTAARLNFIERSNQAFQNPNNHRNERFTV